MISQELANTIHRYESVRDENGVKIIGSKSPSFYEEEIMSEIKERSMAPLYEALCNKFDWKVDDALLSSMREVNSLQLKDIEDKLAEAKISAGDTEVLDQLFAKARYLASIGNWEYAMQSYEDIVKKDKTSTGKKIDATMEKARIAMFNYDLAKMKEAVYEAKRLNDLGGDWDRRNRLKVYEAYYLLAARDVHGAAKLFLECIATFTCTELCSYNDFMFYTLVTSIISLDRNALRKKVVNDPHVITVLRELSDAKDLVNGIYKCDYKAFFQAVLKVQPHFLMDRFLSPVCVYLVREYRVLAYAQFLEAYKSVMLSSMAQSFGITVSLLDSELSRFISAGRLNAKIDKVGDIIETSRPDRKNSQYHDVIKKGDHLLNQIQKLVRSVDV